MSDLVGRSSLRDEAANAQTAPMDSRLRDTLLLLDARAERSQVDPTIRLDKECSSSTRTWMHRTEDSSPVSILAMCVIEGPVSLGSAIDEIVVAPLGFKRRMGCVRCRLLIMTNTPAEQYHTAQQKRSSQRHIPELRIGCPVIGPFSSKNRALVCLVKTQTSRKVLLVMGEPAMLPSLDNMQWLLSATSGHQRTP